MVVRLASDPSTGLSAAEAAPRLEQFGPNRLDAEPPVPAWRKLLEQFVDPLVGLLLAAVAISLATWAVDGAEGVPIEALVIAAILVTNAVLGYVQEERAVLWADELRKIVSMWRQSAHAA